MACVFSSSAGWEVSSRGRPWLQVHMGLSACQRCQAMELCRWSFSYFVQRRPVINIFPTWGSERVWFNQKMLSEEMLNLFCPVFEHHRCGERRVLGHCSCCWPSQLSSLVESGCGRRGMFVIGSLIDLVASAKLLRIIFLFLRNPHRSLWCQVFKWFVSRDLWISDNLSYLKTMQARCKAEYLLIQDFCASLNLCQSLHIPAVWYNLMFSACIIRNSIASLPKKQLFF